MFKYYSWILIIFHLFIADKAFAQHEAKNWYFGKYEGMKFENNQAVELLDGKMDISLGSAVISDNNGNLLFYTDGRTIWNRNHDTLKNGYGLNSWWAMQQAIIIPMPGNPNIYYVFSICAKIYEAQSNEGLWYHIVDMTKDNGYGEVISKNNLISKNVTSRIAATFHSNKKSVWIITHEWNSNKYRSYLLKSTGLDTIPVITAIGSYITMNFPFVANNSGQLKFSPNGKKLSCAIFGDAKIDIFDFDNKYGKLSNPVTLELKNHNIWNQYRLFGLEFSPNSNLLYFSGNAIPGGIFQADISSGNATTIKNSLIKIVNDNSGQDYYAMQLGLDKRIYISRGHAFFSRINDPDKKGSSCNYTDSAITFTRVVRTGLPTFLQSYFYLPDIEIESSCYGDSTTYGLKDTTNIDSVYWAFGDSNYSMLFYPKHVYADTGFYMTQAVIFYDNTGDTFEREIRISNYAYADFAIADNSQCLRNNSYQFYDSSTAIDGSMTYEWDFGDSSGSFQQNPIKSFLVADTFRVKLTVTSSYGCETSVTKEIYVRPMPVADYSINDSSQCFNEQYFVASDSSVISGDSISNYDWYIDSSLFSNQQIDTLPNLQAATWNLKLVTTTTNGCKDSITKPIIVHPSPITNFSINDSVQCFNEQNFIATSLSLISGYSISNYYWSIDSSSLPNQKTVTLPNLNPATWNLKLVTQTSNGCTDSITKPLTVLPSPIAEFSINDSVQCFNNNLFLLNFSKVPNFGKVEWNLGDSTISTDTSIIHTYKLPGNYPVQLIIENQQGCADTAAKSVTVHPSPIANFSINDSVQCFNENLFLFKSLSGFGTLSGLNYKWDFGDNTISTDTHTVKSFSFADTFTVQLLAVSPDACRDSISRQVVVLESPKAEIVVNDSSQCLLGNEFIFFNQSGSGQAVGLNYSWEFGDFTQSQDSSPFKTYLHADTFLVSLILTTDFDCKDAAYKEVFVRPMPKAAFSIDKPSQCLNGNNFNFSNLSSISSGNLDFKWYIDNSLSNTSQQFNNLAIQQYGNFPIKLLAESDYHCLDSISQTIYIHPMPKADFSFSLPCLEKEIQFSGKSSIPQGSVNNWKWYFTSNDSSALQHPVFVFNNPGDHQPKLIARSDSGCVDTVSKTITIYDHAPAVELERVSVVNDKYNLLEWKAPASPIVSAYQIQKSSNFGNFINLKTYPKDSLHLTDFAVFPDQSIYTYHILTEDSCGHSSEPSNIAQTILLQLDSSETFSILSWSAYEDWKQGIQRYEVHIFSKQTQSWEKLESFVFPTEFTDSITKLSQSEYCYRIAAFRNNDELQSHSNVVCADTRMNLFVPNAFSPNGDGINDHFQIKGVFINEFNIQIFNRWGEKLFESDDINTGWDGTFKGDICPLGIYYYQIMAKGSGNHKNQLSGSISLIR